VLDHAEPAGVALQYSVSAGDPHLREGLVGSLRGKGVVGQPDTILITHGSQQALYLTARPADLVELQAFSANAPVDLPLPALDDPKLPRAKLAYVMPDYANPTGETMTLAERAALPDAAEKHNLAIIEDAAYTELRYKGAPRPSLLALDCERSGGIASSHVISCGPFSKTVIPGLRLGWIPAPSSVITKALLPKQADDPHTSTLTQMVLTDVAGQLPQSQMARLCEVYGARRDAMLRGLAVHRPPGLRWTRPMGGMSIGMTLPDGVDASQALHAAIEANVAFVPGATCFAGERKANTAPLSFTLCDEPVIDDGAERLGRLLTRDMAH
jgi:DNA-binding transcriptional MocR family regulator